MASKSVKRFAQKHECDKQTDNRRQTEKQTTLLWNV